jgi:hypothetical protein
MVCTVMNVLFGLPLVASRFYSTVFALLECFATLLVTLPSSCYYKSKISEIDTKKKVKKRKNVWSCSVHQVAASMHHQTSSHRVP